MVASKTVAFFCYRPGAAELSSFDAALLTIIRNEKFLRHGLTVRDIWRRFSFLPMSTFATICGDTMPTLVRIRRGIARLKRAGLIARSTSADATAPYRWLDVKRLTEVRDQSREYLRNRLKTANA